MRGKLAKRASGFFASQQRVHLRYVKPRLRLLRHRERMLRDIAAPFDEVPEAARRARYCYACFAHVAEDSQAYGHYFHTRLAQQFDAVIHIEETSAVEALDVGRVWSEREAPETFPSDI